MELERAPRSELLKTIEQQKDLIQRREQRLRDVISAYKGVLKEKEALESSVKVLSQSKARSHHDVPHSKGPASDSASDRGLESDRESEDGSKTSTKDISDPLNVSSTIKEEDESGEEDSEVSQLREQLHTLSTSLLTLTQEKSKLEASYIANKKALKSENEELQRKNKENVDKIADLEKSVGKVEQEWRNRVRNQQIEREKEQIDHSVMLRELQKLLAVERQAKEQLEQQHDEATFSLKEQERLIPEMTSKHETLIIKLKEDVASLRNQLVDERNKAEQPSPMLVNLQKQTAELKAEHSRLLQEDRSRVQDAQVMATDYSKQCEARIAELEAKLSDLSESVGNYERLRYQDQQAIQRLKERSSQLDLENTALMEASRATQDDDSIADVPRLVERINKLKSQLKLANARAEQPINIEEVLLDGLETEHPLVRKYREDLELVRDEFERYRLRAQSVLKNKKETPVPRDDDVLREHVNELREKLRSLHLQQDQELEHFRQREEHGRKTMQVLQDKHKQEVTQMQAEHYSQLQELEEEMKKQRDRTVSMLAEKERELELIRAKSSQRLQSDYMMSLRSSYDMAGASSERQTTEDEAVTRLLTAPPSGQGEMTLLYFAQEQARKDVDLSGLRKQKRDLELALRDLQMSSGTKQEELFEEIDHLKEEMRKLDRSISREGANLEYLKNVTYKFLICHDPVGKQQMLNAITTILQFSPQEKTTVQAQNKGWWGVAAT